MAVLDLRLPGLDGLQDGHIGLASSERRVQAVGGELVVESGPGRGSTIRATLPRAASPATVA